MQNFLLTALLLASVPALAQSGMALEPDTVLLAAPPAPVSEWTADGIRKPVSLKLADGTELRGFRFAASRADAPELLFFNGLGMTVTRSDRAYRAFAEAGANVTVYDYRGWGLSDGPASIMTSRADSLAAYDALKQSAGTRPVLVFGASLGTTMAAYVASQRPVSALVLGMPIASAGEELPAFGRMIGYPPQMLAAVVPSDNFKSLLNEVTLVQNSTAPLLVMGSPADIVVPIAQNRAVFTASPATSKQFVEVPDVDHNHVILAPQSLAALRTLVQQLR